MTSTLLIHVNLRIRRIYTSGRAAVVSLPADWLRGNSLAPGDQVEVRYDGEVHIRPKKREVPDGERPIESVPA